MNRSIDYSKCEYLPDENSNSNENMLFLRKTDEKIWKPLLLREPPLLQLTSSISEQFFHDPPLWPNFKNEIPHPNIRRGGNYDGALSSA